MARKTYKLMRSSELPEWVTCREKEEAICEDGLAELIHVPPLCEVSVCHTH